MALSTQPYKGARDFYPDDKRTQSYIFWVLRMVAESYGYQEYDAPLIEPFELYAAKSGEEIVNDQLYSFEDRGGRKVAIRPEMTPSVSRMVAAKRQELSYPLRLYSIPNLWRYERPQRGRLREHWQLNVDLFGVEGEEADAEIIQVADAILKALGAKPDMYRININSRKAMVEAMNSFGLSETELKAAYKAVDKMPKLTEDEFNRLLSENLGAEKAPKLREYLKDNRPPEKVKRVLDILEASNVGSAVYEPSVVRGIEYYNDIVFEVFDADPENVRSLFGGGRYDGLVELFGVECLLVVGFGMGDVSLLNFLQTHHLEPVVPQKIDVNILLAGSVYADAQKQLAYLRSRGVRLAVDLSGRKLDAQLKSAVKSGLRYAVVVGDHELQNNVFKLRDLEKSSEEEFDLERLADALLERRVHKVTRK